MSRASSAKAARQQQLGPGERARLAALRAIERGGERTRAIVVGVETVERRGLDQPQQLFGLGPKRTVTDPERRWSRAA
jgi:hypothetical protein